MFWITQIATVVAVLIASLSMLSANIVPSMVVEQSEVLAAQDFVFEANDQLPNLNRIARHVAEARREIGLPPIVVDEQLNQLAAIRAEDMRKSNYYAHDNPESGVSFVDTLRDANYVYSYACENLNLQFHKQEASFVTSWLASRDGHRECMLHPEISRVGYAVTTVPLATDLDLSSYVIVAIHVSPNR